MLSPAHCVSPRINPTPFPLPSSSCVGQQAVVRLAWQGSGGTLCGHISYDVIPTWTSRAAPPRADSPASPPRGLALLLPARPCEARPVRPHPLKAVRAH